MHITAARAKDVQFKTFLTAIRDLVEAVDQAGSAEPDPEDER